MGNTAAAERTYYKGPNDYDILMTVAICTKRKPGAKYQVGDIFVFSAPTAKEWRSGTGGESGNMDIRIPGEEYREYFTEDHDEQL